MKLSNLSGLSPSRVASRNNNVALKIDIFHLEKTYYGGYLSMLYFKGRFSHIDGVCPVLKQSKERMKIWNIKHLIVFNTANIQTFFSHNKIFHNVFLLKIT